jgi:hypothetical protein
MPVIGIYGLALGQRPIATRRRTDERTSRVVRITGGLDINAEECAAAAGWRLVFFELGTGASKRSLVDPTTKECISLGRRSCPL